MPLINYMELKKKKLLNVMLFPRWPKRTLGHTLVNAITYHNETIPGFKG